MNPIIIEFMLMQHAKKMIYELDIDASMKACMCKSFARRLELFGKYIFFFREPFTPISMTGLRCSLSCKHCESYYLRHMIDGSNGKLFSEASGLAEDGAKGILLSGGCTEDGSVPTYMYADEIIRTKNHTNLKMSAHTGIVNRAQAEALSKYLDMALIDVSGDDGTIHDVLGMDGGAKNYERTLEHLSAYGIPLAPHIIVGLDKGKLKGEFRALEMVKKFNPEIVVIVVFIPTKGTPLEGILPPVLSDVMSVIIKAREMFDVPLSLSCVRPGGRYRMMLDKFAILAGIDRIAVPTMNAYSVCSELELNIVEIPKMCCSYKV